MTKAQKKKRLINTIRQYEDAYAGYLWLGTFEPDSWAEIKRNLKRAKVQLNKALRKVLK